MGEKYKRNHKRNHKKRFKEVFPALVYVSRNFKFL